MSFQPAIIKFALDEFVDGYAREKLTKTTPHHYKSSVYARLEV